MCSIITHFWCTKISQNFSYPQAGSRQKGNFMYKWYRKCMFEVCLNYVCEKMWSKKYIKYCKMFIKYASTPLRMDKKKRYKKTLVQTWRPRNYPEAICYFLYHFLCRFNKRWRTEEDRRGEENKKTPSTSEAPEKMLKLAK